MINAHREMVVALEKFRKIMSKPCPQNFHENPGDPMLNPLLTGSNVPE